MPDMDMESVKSNTYKQIHQRAEYDPDDLWMAEPRRTQVAATSVTTETSIFTQKIIVSAISELKESLEKDWEEDRVRIWMSKVKSAFLRDQASEEEKFLVFGDLVVGPVCYWYRQLSRSKRFKWKDLMNSFLVEYTGHGMSASRQYYHAKKRSEEDPLEYLYRLNVMGTQANISVMTGLPDARKEHVNHLIDTLDDPNLSNQLLLLNVEDTEVVHTIMHGYQRGRSRQRKVMMESSKFRQKGEPASVPSKPARAVRMICTEDVSSESGLDTYGSESEDRLRSIHVASTTDRLKPTRDTSANTGSEDPTTRQDYQGRSVSQKPRTR
uniref:Retrotransposon gag domain-containing protein n=1 Tax=Peronospora matthiolae TaxID=2874970 RepID=A0AAV1VC59_9STRA